MKIVMFSINPLFPNKITGGASKHLYHISRHLGGMGHEIEILCARSVETQKPFVWSDGVNVLPILPFHLPFPQPYAVSGAELGLMVSHLSSALEKADRFYIHDSEWLISDLYESIPTITSVRDNVYPESILGTYLTKADAVICISDYSANVVRTTAGYYFPDLLNRIHKVNNGIEFSSFSRKPAQKLADQLGVDPEHDAIILHPHRPEAGKGLEETIRVTAQLVHKYQVPNIKVIIPEWIGEMVSSSESQFYKEMMELMDVLDVRKRFVFMPWLPNEKMPELYSLGNVTLCLGSFVETFGNVAYESLACGTPSVVAKVGVHRTLLPDDMLAKVNYNDIDAAANKAYEILKTRKSTSQETLDFLQTHLDFTKQVNAYASIITHCQKQPRLQFKKPHIDQNTQFWLAPWCYLDGNRIFNDYTSDFNEASNLSKLSAMKGKFSFCNAEEIGVSKSEWLSWRERTWITPVLA